MDIPNISSLKEKVLALKKRLNLQIQNKRALLGKRHYSVRDFFLLFILAILGGAGVKILVNDRLTIGFDDYRLASTKNVIDLNHLQKELIQKGSSRKEATPPQGKTCTE